MVSFEEAPKEIASKAIRIPTYLVQVARSTGSLAIGSSLNGDHPCDLFLTIDSAPCQSVISYFSILIS